MVARRARLDTARTGEIAGENASEGRPGAVLLAGAEQGAPVRRLEGEHLAGLFQRGLDLAERGAGAGSQHQLARLVVTDAGEMGQVKYMGRLDRPSELALRPAGDELDGFLGGERADDLVAQFGQVGGGKPRHDEASTPRRIWSRSIDSNRARKLPSPNPSFPLRWMISKKIGPITVSVKICSSSPWPASGAPSIRIRSRFNRARSSACPGTLVSTAS